MALTLTSDPIVPIEVVQERLGAHGDDAIILINAATEKFLGYTQRIGINSAERTEFIRGIRLDYVWLHATPVTAIDSCELLVNGDVSTTFTADDYELYATEGKLWFHGTSISDTGENNLKVVYTAGWTAAAIPGDIIETALEVMRVDKERTEGRTGITSISVEGQSKSYETDGLPKSVRDVWDRYRFWV